MSSDNGLISELTHDQEAAIFWQLRWRTIRTHVRQAFSTSRLRVALVTGLSLFFWCALFFLFYEGFCFLTAHVGGAGAAAHAMTVRLVFHVFFASLNVMLIFSAGIILYGVLFRSSETTFLLAMPVRPSRIVLHKFQEAVFFSSWGFLLLGSPLLLAYGIVVHAPWSYYALILPFIGAFVYIPCSLGALACLIIVRWLHRFGRVFVLIASSLALLVVFFTIWQAIAGGASELFGPKWFQTTLQRFGFTRQYWLPSTWLASGLLEAARHANDTLVETPWVESIKYLSVLFSNAMLLHLIVVWTGSRLLLPCYSASRSRGSRARSPNVSLIDKIAAGCMRPFGSAMATILVKDLRLFRRDPAQWSQFLIFFGLLGLYLMNLDRFGHDYRGVGYRAWINIVSFLNLAVVGLILSTFTTRFIFPMLSMEGARFWILGLVPVKRDLIVWSKFAFASLGAWGPAALLVLISDLMLQVNTSIVIFHQLSCVLLCAGLAAISVGLGAAMASVREDSPAKIAASFGGTLSLVLSATYIIVIVSLTALPCHFVPLALDSGVATDWVEILSLESWIAVGFAIAGVVTAVAVVAPMRIGLRTFRSREF